MKAICCKCQSELKYPVNIGGKIYGSSCASKHLGINDIPKHFTGNYDSYKKEKEERIKANQSKIINQVNLKNTWFDKWVEQSKRITKIYRNANLGFEKTFVFDIIHKCSLTISENPTKNSLTWEHLTFQPNWIENLSPKQLAILERIENR